MRKQKLIVVILTTMFYSILSINIIAQSPASVTWSLLTNVSSSNSGSVTSESMAIGSYLSGTSFGSTFNTSSTGWMRVATTSPQLPASYTATSYVEFTISPSTGNDLIVTTISANVGGGGTNNCKLAAYYSISNFSTTPGTNLGNCNYNSGTRTTTTASPVSLVNSSSVTDANSLASFSSLNISVTNGQTLKVRFYVWSTSTNKYFPLKNVVISGTTTSLSCTSPDSKTVSGNATICSGNSTDVTLASSQSGVTYQLYAGASASGSAVSGTGSDLVWSVSPSTTTTYTVKTTTAGGYCETTMSGSAEVTVNAATSISTQSTSTQSKFVGESFNPMTVTAAGTGTLSYQWKSSDDEATNTSGDDANVGTNSNSFTPSSASAGTKYYYCVVTGDCGSATSAVSGAIITNNTVPTVVLTSGSNASTVNVNAAMTSAVYTYSYVGDDANVLADWYTDNTYATTTTAPSGLSITKDTGAKTVTISGTPANGVYGTLYYKLIVNETNGNSIEGTITVNVPTPTITLSSTASTNAQTIKANTAIASITYTVTNASGATVGTLPAGLSGVYDNGTFTISGTIDIAATLGTANYTVTATPYTGYGGSAVTASGSVVVKSATAKDICYLVATSTQSANDTQIYPNLNSNNNYLVTLRTAAGTAPAASIYDDYELIVLTESVGGTNAEAVALKSVNKPILSFKAYTYSTGRWGWGTPDNGKQVTTGTVSVKQPNHPIFTGLTLNNGTFDLLSGMNGTTNGVQVADVTLADGIPVAVAPKSTTGNPMATAIHDVPGSARGAGITSRYILIPIADLSFNKVTNDGLTLINNAIDYLINGTQFVAEKNAFRSKATGNWSTTANSSWESSYDNTNWSQDVVAPAYINATAISILNGHTITVDANATAPSVTVKSGAKLSVPDTKTLDITGDLTLESDGVNHTGTIVDSNTSTAGITVSGTTTVNQNLTYRTWYMSSPVSGAQPAGMDRIKYYNESDNTWSTLYNSGLSVGQSALAYQGNMEVGKGYLVIPVSGNSIAFTGTLNTGSKSIALTKNTSTNPAKSGFNFVGNPYPSYLDWIELYTANSTKIQSSMWYRSKENGTTYKFWTVNNEGVGSNAAANKDIAPMQGFWVRALAADNLELTNDMRSHAPGSNYLMKAPAAKNTALQLVRLQVSNGVNTDEAVIYLSQNAQNGIDNCDSRKMTNDNVEIPEIYTTIAGDKLVINALNSLPLNQPISLGLDAGSATSFSLHASEVANLPSDVHVVLKDHANGVETDLTDGVTSYSFSPAIVNGNRFSVIFRSSAGTTAVKSTSTVKGVYSKVNGIIAIENENLTGSVVSVYTTTGQLLEAKKMLTTVMTFDKVYLPGVYMVKTANASAKVIVK